MRTGVRSFAPDRLQAAREQAHLDRRSIAHLLNISVAAVTSWESGSSAPTPRHLIKLADVLHLAPDDLIRVPRHEADLGGLRERTGLSSLEVAERLGVSRATYSNLETAAGPLTASRKNALAEIFQCPQADIAAAWERTHANWTRLLAAPRSG